MADLTDTLASYITSSSYEALPPEVRREGVRAFGHWVGCAAGGAREDAVERALEVLVEFNGARDATVIGRPEKLDALNAAFINSLSSSAVLFNDTHLTSGAHPTGPVAAALLALAERQPIPGREFLHALILGIEIQCRVGNILTVPPAECSVGLSMVGLVGAIGAAVAAGKVLGLDEKGMATAIGLAANQAGGLRQTQASMATTQPSGHSARCGLMAAFLAARGFSCSDKMIDGPNGFAVSYAARPNFAAAVDKLGQTFEIASLSYKPYPCGFVSHPSIDACLDVARQEGFDAAQVERIELTVNPVVMKLMNRPDPQNRDDASFSVQHWAAAALVCKAAGIAQTTEAMTRAPLVCDLRRKVVLKPDPSVGREAAEAQVLLKGGVTLKASVLHCRGSTGRPMNDDDITEKTRAQLLTVFPAPAAERIVAECWRIEQYPSAGALCQHLSAASAKGHV